MIIHVVHVYGVRPLKVKDKTPVAAHRDRVKPGQMTAQAMEPPPWRIHVVGARCMLQSGKLDPELAGMLRLNSRFRSRQEEAFETLVTEALDHAQEV